MDDQNQNNSTYFTNNNQPNILLISFIIFQLIFAIILAVFISQSTQIKPMVLNIDTLAKIDITNDSIIPDLANKELIESIEQTLFSAVVANSETKSAAHSLKASFHEDSINAFKFSDQGPSYFGAIIDVLELSESYQLMLQYSTDDIDYRQPSFVIFCPEKDKQLYSSFNCKDIISHDEKIKYISSQIPNFSFDKFSAYMRANDYSTIYIGPISNTVTETDKTAYTNQTKEAVKSLGINPDQFSYYVLTAEDIVYDY